MCENLIARAELEESDPDPDWELGQDRYEKELERHWP